MSKRDKVANENNTDIFKDDLAKSLVRKILDENDENDDFDLECEEYEYNGKPENDIDTDTNFHSKIKNISNVQKHKETFFDDDFENDESDENDDFKQPIILKFISIGIIIVLAISTTILAITLKNTKNELSDTKYTLKSIQDESQKVKQEILEESLRNEIASLKTENENLKNQTTSDVTKNIDSKKSSNTSTQKVISNNNKAREYTVKEGDRVWDISKEMYGTGAHFQKILDANGLKEDSILKPNQKLIIPNIN